MSLMTTAEWVSSMKPNESSTLYSVQPPIQCVFKVTNRLLFTLLFTVPYQYL